ncbi:MAG: YdcF family protein [Clostridia bacterium]|nr:YdcF family protein [Clostridia bacterium]
MVKVFFIAYYLLLFLLGIGLFGNGVRVVKKEGKSVTHILPFFCGFLLLASSVIGVYNDVIGVTGIAWFVKLETIVSYCAAYIPLALFGVWLANDIYRKSPKEPETDFIIVLGCGIKKNGEVTPLLKGRLDKAVEVFETGERKAKIIVSGGQGSDEIISEAEAMKNYLLSIGIPESSIILENKSTTTMENLSFSKKIMEEKKKDYHCTISTSSYHVLRSAMFAKKLNLNASCVGGKTAAYYYPAAFLREYAAIIMKNKYALAIYALLVGIPFLIQQIMIAGI